MTLINGAPCFYPRLAAESESAPDDLTEYGPLGHVGAWGIDARPQGVALFVVQLRRPKPALVIRRMFDSRSLASTAVADLKKKLALGELEKFLADLPAI